MPLNWHLIKSYLIDKKWVILIMGGLVGLLSIGYIQMLNAFNLGDLAAVIATFPEGFLAFFGDIHQMGSAYGFVCLEFFIMFWLYGGLIVIWVAAGLIPQEIEDKTMEIALTKPINRNDFLGSKMIFFYLFLFGMFSVIFTIFSLGTLISPSLVEEGLRFHSIWATYVNCALYIGALASITIFISMFVLKTKKAMIGGITVLFVMFFLNGIAPYFDQLKWLAYFSVFRFFNPIDYIVLGDGFMYFRDLIVLLIANAAFIIGSFIVFNKKDIPI